MSDDLDVIIVYATFPSPETAKEMAEVLIDARLAGCVNLLPGMTSVYRWAGRVETADEVVMIVKTRTGLKDRVIARIEALHPYDTPAILTLDVTGGSHDYIEWLCRETEEVRQPSQES